MKHEYFIQKGLSRVDRWYSTLWDIVDRRVFNYEILGPRSEPDEKFWRVYPMPDGSQIDIHPRPGSADTSRYMDLPDGSKVLVKSGDVVQQRSSEGKLLDRKRVRNVPLGCIVFPEYAVPDEEKNSF